MMPHIDSASDHQSAYRLRFQEIICIKNNLKRAKRNTHGYLGLTGKYRSV